MENQTEVATEAKEAVKRSPEQLMEEAYEKEKEQIDRANAIFRKEKKGSLAEAGVTEEHIAGWKQAYGPVEALTINDQTYVYRGVGRLEFKNMNKSSTNVDPSVREEILVEKCVLYPQLNRMDFANYSAGVISQLADRVMGLSGFIGEDSEVPVRL